MVYVADAKLLISHQRTFSIRSLPAAHQEVRCDIYRVRSALRRDLEDVSVHYSVRSKGAFHSCRRPRLFANEQFRASLPRTPPISGNPELLEALDQRILVPEPRSRYPSMEASMEVKERSIQVVMSP